MARGAPRASIGGSGAHQPTGAGPREARMPQRRFEFRVRGRLSEHTRQAFTGMEVTDVPAETVISTTVTDDGGVQEILALIQALGLSVVSVERVSGE